MDLRRALPVPLLAGFALFVGALLAPAAHADQPGGLGVTVQTGANDQPVVVLTNQGTASCQVSPMALGTIDLTGVHQAGRMVEAIAMIPSFDEDLGFTISQHLRLLPAGASLRVPLDEVSTGPTGHALRTVSWSSAVTVGALYPFDPARPLTLAASYTAPDLTVTGRPLCEAGIAATGTAVTTGPAAAALTAPGDALSNHPTNWLLWVVLGTVALFAVVLAWVLTQRRRSRRRAGAGAMAVVLLAAAIGFGSPPAKAEATVTGGPGVANGVAGCLAGFNTPGGDPADIMNTLNKPSVHVTINLDTSGNNGENRIDPQNIFIYWDPDDTSMLSGDVPRIPCDELYHELFHASQDTTPEGVDVHECFDGSGHGTGIAIKEVEATKAENMLRRNRHETLRTVYGPNPLPPGKCRPSRPGDPLCHPSLGCPLPPSRAGQTTADPHVTTFDGRRLDFQAAGEFVVSKDIASVDPATAFQVQVREEPWRNSRQVGVNTAMAANVAGDRVEVFVQDGQMEVRVNSANHPLTSGPLPEGGDLIYTPRKAGPFLTIDWPDHSYTLVTTYSRSLTLIVVPAPIHNGHLTGLLADADGNPADDLHLASGSATGAPTYDDLYPKFAESLRITQQNSLFTYGPGTSTQTYTDRTFPDRNSAPSPRRAWAESACALYGITDPISLQNCVVDLANTGNSEFLAASMLTQANATSFQLGGGGTTLAVTKAGQQITVPFRGTAGQKLYVDVVASTLPSGCGWLRLQDPTGKLLAAGCIINGKGGIDVVVLPVTGSYLVVVDPPAGATGSVSMRLVSATDQQGGLTIDGPPATIAVTAAGGLGRLTFSGQKGEVVYAGIPTSTLPDSCGSVSIQDLQQHRLGSGCVINGVGSIDRVTLPATGTYAFVLDPADAVTGSMQVRLTSATDQIGTIGVDGPTVTATIAQPGAVALLTFSGSVGERVYVDASGGTLADQCGVIFLRDPTGNTANGGCVIGGKGDIDATLLKENGTYTIVVDPSAADLGSVQLRVFRDTDQQGAISINGPAVTAAISQPGAVSRFTFQGSAGQKVAVSATGATFTGGCSVLQLKDAADQTLTSGCVLSGHGNTDVVDLPSTGTFTVVLDLGGGEIGQAQLQLTSG